MVEFLFVTEGLTTNEICSVGWNRFYFIYS